MGNDTSHLVPIHIAARWLRVPAKWLRDEAEAGRIPCLRAGKSILCDFAAVEATLLDRARQGQGKVGTDTGDAAEAERNYQPAEVQAGERVLALVAEEGVRDNAG